MSWRLLMPPKGNMQLSSNSPLESVQIVAADLILLDELYERLENLMETSQTMGRHAGKTLKNLVYDILLDAKDLGAVDLNWLQQYVGPL